MSLNAPHTPTKFSLQMKPLMLVLCTAGFLLLYWTQTIYVPYWGDDYLFLLDAQQAHIESRSWYAPFIPQTKVLFWRPLGMETYWRFIETFLNGNVVAAHCANTLLISGAAAAVGWFVAKFISLLAPEKNNLPAAVLAAFLYGIHSSHFLPAAWVSAANDSICVVFSALALRLWLVILTADTHKRWGSELLLILCFLLSMLSRDIAFVLPPIGFLLALWLWPRYKPTLRTWCVGLGCISVAFAWLILRNHFTTAADPAYEMRFGTNVLRNAGCLLLFFFNTPFECLRYIFLNKASFGIVLWGIACFIPQVAAFGILLQGARVRLGIKGALILSAFFVIGCAPYFLLNFNCYPYYTSIALIGYAILAGLATLREKALITVLLLTIIASTLSTAGNFFFDSPSHIGRAWWTEKQLVMLEMLRKTNPRLFSDPFYVVVEDNHRFQGFRSEGLTYRLGVDLKRIALLNPNSPEAGKHTVLVVPKEGDVYFRESTQAEFK